MRPQEESVSESCNLCAQSGASTQTVDEPSIQVRSQRTAHRLGHRLDLVAVTVMVDADTQ